MVRALIGRIVAIAAAALPLAAAAVDLQGHRGARGLLPENTLPGFARAIELGVTTLETDVAVTKDGVVVISHDPDLNPALVRGPSGLYLFSRGPMIRTLTLAELKTYDIGRVNSSSNYGRNWPEQQPRDGERFPTLDDLFALVKARNADVRFNIEIKITPTSGDTTPDPATFARLTIDRIRAADAVPRTTLQSFDWRPLVESRKLEPALATSCLTAETPNFDTTKVDASGRSPWMAGLVAAEHGNSVPRLVKAAGCDYWSANHEALSAARVKEAQALGLKVLAWTVNQPADIAKVLDFGVDGVITDYPDRARKVFADKGIAAR